MDCRGFTGQSLCRAYNMLGITRASKWRAIKLATERAGVDQERASDTMFKLPGDQGIKSIYNQEQNFHHNYFCMSPISFSEYVKTSLLTHVFSPVSFPEPQPANHFSEEPFGCSEEESAFSSVGQRSTEVTVGACVPSPPPPPSPSSPAQVKETTQTPKLFTPSKLSFTVRTFSGKVLCNLRTEALETKQQQITTYNYKADCNIFYPLLPTIVY